MEKMKCSRCGSDKIMPNLRIHDRYRVGHENCIGIEVLGKPGAAIFKETHREFMRATACGDCGNVDLTVDNPKRLWETYTKSQKT